ncbi:MAG: hypothetical protein H0V01_10410 [Bacteroidetes bacterium]|nr:hypothetical protein [Bacteroidota bacterium]HET6243853.1 hypothetical protein [Bacteroidia bacterium]
MKKNITIFVILILITLKHYGQQNHSGLFYNSTKELIANHEFKLTKDQLKKWKKLEFRIVTAIMDSLKYPPMAKDAGVYASIIISYTVDNKGNFENFHIETPENTQKKYNQFLTSVASSVKSNSQFFLQIGFKSESNQTEKYFLPVVFKISSDTAFKSIKNGWIEFTVKESPLIWRDYVLSTNGCEIVKGSILKNQIEEAKNTSPTNLIGKWKVIKVESQEETIYPQKRNYYLSLSENSINYNLEVNNCGTEDFVINSDEILLGDVYCTEICCDGRHDEISNYLIYSGKYELKDSTLTIFNNKGIIFLNKE